MSTFRLLALSLLAMPVAMPVVLDVSDASAQSIVVNIDREPRPGGRTHHVAEEGDTLFDLARRYLGDELLWPLLWSYNPQVTNPHWIYPGDIVFLGPEARDEAVGALFENATGRLFPLGGFYTSEEIDVLGSLIYADTGRRLLSEYDTVYLDFAEDDDVVVGDHYAVNRITGRVYNEDDELVGVKYIVMGTVQVTRENSETDLYTGMITEMWDAMERGDAIFLSELQQLEVRPRTNEVSLEASIYDRLSPGALLHEQDIIFIDVGSEDGVMVGNRLHVWDRQDEGANFDLQLIRRQRRRGQSNMASTGSYLDERGRRLSYEQVQDRLPWQLVGEAMVIYVTDEYATAIITNGGTRELYTGQRLTMTAGE